MFGRCFRKILRLQLILNANSQTFVKLRSVISNSLGGETANPDPIKGTVDAEGALWTR